MFLLLLLLVIDVCGLVIDVCGRSINIPDIVPMEPRPFFVSAFGAVRGLFDVARGGD